MLFGLTETKTRVDRAAGKDTMVFTCYCDASFDAKLGKRVGQTDTAELVHLSHISFFLSLLGCMCLFNFMYDGRRSTP